MDVNQHHTEWLSLLDIQGAFLTLDVVNTALPQGLDTLTTGTTTRVREVYLEWGTDNLDNRIHQAWINWILTEILEYPPSLLVEAENIPPQYQDKDCPLDKILINPTDSSPLLFIKILPPTQKLEAIPKQANYSPTTAMMRHLQSQKIRIGLLTNGEQWMLINAPSKATCGFISWYSQIWLEENITLRSFTTLLGISRFLKVAEKDKLPNLLEESIHTQQSVTDQLGYQVRKAIEILLRRIDIISLDPESTYLHNLGEEDIYTGVMSIMLRLIFLLTVEAKELLPLDNTIYSQNYALYPLAILLRDQADRNGEEILALRRDAWGRILANFRAVYAGINHPSLTLYPYQGNLFNPDNYPFLEGREKGTSWLTDESDTIFLDNRTFLHVLEAITLLKVAKPGGGYEPRRISFKSLDVEQIGHIYESLLDHKIERASTTILKLICNKNQLGLVSLEELEAYREKGDDELVNYLKTITKRTATAIKKALYPEDITQIDSVNGLLVSRNLLIQRFLLSCRGDTALWERIKPFCGLIEWDTFEYPIIIPKGSIYLTQGEDRRETGTHYTPKSLTANIVKHTLDPLVYRGCKQGKPESEWELITSDEILELKICDVAAGSGAFLVQTCRYLGEKLLTAWEKENKAVIGGDEKDRQIRLTNTKRLVVERCIYGVDKNPVAVEMAKLSLWLETLHQYKPFTFLDHAIKSGDSLVGVGVNQLLAWDLDVDVNQQVIGGDSLAKQISEVIELRERIETSPQLSLDEKAYLLTQATARINDLKDRGDLLVKSYLIDGKSQQELKGLRQYLLMVSQGSVGSVGSRENEEIWGLLDNGITPFHWELEFPEVFLTERKGFDGLVGNPPFMGGYKISGVLGNVYREYLTKWIAGGKKGGQGDLVAYFFLRINGLVRDGGCCGLVATNTICQGDTREVGLDQLVEKKGINIYRGVASAKWEGTASLEVSHIWWSKDWNGEYWLNGEKVEGITPYLSKPGKIVGNPHRLISNKGKSFQGSKVYGMGFVLTPDEALELINKNERNKRVLFPYLNGEDLNTHPNQSPSRWVINFQDWLLSPDMDDNDNPKGGPYASDFPDCLDIVERLVKPEREKLRDTADGIRLKQKWWLFCRTRPELYETIKDYKRTLIRSCVSNYHSLAFAPTNIVYSHATAILAFDDYANFAILQSMAHTEWLNQNASTMRKDIRYTPSDCFETFPFPINAFLPGLAAIGERYYTHRQNIMTQNQEGLTKTYNRFHSPHTIQKEVKVLRDLHIEMDEEVKNAYGWNDLILQHDFYTTKQGLRFTISDTARREILDRLLALNHDLYAQEVANGLHDKKNKGKKRKK